jgi:SAM-dependent methyltransferase
MPQDVRDLAAFYGTPLGQRTRRLLLRRLRALWPDLRGRRLLGYGFAVPYLRAFTEAERAIAACPSPLGVTVWPHGRNAALVCEEDALPFPDVLFDRILIVHGLEASESLRALLRQLWRVLAPEGKVVLVAANRASLWAQVERSPFGHGRPFSRHELDVLLRGAMFAPGHWERALYAPPATTFTGSGNSWEKLGARLFPGIGGVHIVEASKSLYAPASPGLAQAVKQPALKAAQDFNLDVSGFSSEERSRRARTGLRPDSCRSAWRD